MSAPEEAPFPTPRRGFRAWAFAGIVLATLAAYAPALRGVLLWNDPDYVTKPSLRSLHGLWRIWFDLGATEQYYPILHSAFWVEHRLWGDAPIGYHLLNVLLHAAAACLLATILGRLSVRGAVLAGFVFALHPVCVESVAWISEEKNTLSTVFFLLAALAYLEWREPRDGRSRPRLYGLATLLFVLALLSKTVTASLPAVLLLISWWRQGRLSWSRDVRPLVPWFVVGAASGLFSAWVERVYIGAQGALFALNLGERCLLAGRAAWFYLGKLLWPSNLIFFYPRWTIDPKSWPQYLYLAGAMGLALCCWRIRRRSRGPLTVFLFFVGTLFPTLGFFNVYAFVFSYVADHWQYLPSLGVIAGVSAAWGAWRERSAGPLPAIAAAAAVGTLGILTWRQAGIYRNVETLYRVTLERNPDAWIAHNNLGDLLVAQGRPQEAIPEYRAAMRLTPWYPEIPYNLGCALAMLGRREEAVAEYREAIRLHPAYPDAQMNLGILLAQLGRFREAIDPLIRALSYRPADPGLHTCLGSALAATGRPDEAIGEYERALRLDPGSAQTHYLLANVLANGGRLAEAVGEYDAAVRLRPDYPEAQANLGLALATAGRPAEALAPLAAAIRLNPRAPEPHAYLGMALAELGRLGDAVTEYRESLRLYPGAGAVHYQLGLALRSLGDAAGAEAEFRAAAGH